MLRRTVKWSLQFRYIVLAIGVGLVYFGVARLREMPIDVFPEFAPPRVEIQTEVGVGTEFRVIVPITLAVLPCLLVEAGHQRHAIPMHSIVLAQSDGPALPNTGTDAGAR